MGKNSGQAQATFQLALEKSRSPRAFVGAESLWKEDLERIHRLIDAHLESVKSEKRHSFAGERADPEVQDDTARDELHLSIAIFGPSGSGKSSLLRTLAYLERGAYREAIENENTARIYALPVMDPTTWHPDDRFLYAFLAVALEQERTQAGKLGKGSYPRGLSPVQVAFQDVNEYLRVIDEPHGTGEHDPLGLSLQKLERHTSGLRLKAALGRFIDQLAKELSADAVILPVDDLDMAPDHLVGALQTYQSYLTHPRLIPIFSFTERMPEELIEVYYQRRLEGRANRQPVSAGDRLTIGEKLAVQFLARCFPVRNRIRLGPAPARVQRAIFAPHAETVQKDGFRSEGSRALSVLEMLTISSFMLFGHPDQEDAHSVRAMLRPSTLRRQIQVVDAMFDCRLDVFRSPQLAKMASRGVSKEGFRKIVAQIQGADVGHELDGWPRESDRLRSQWRPGSVPLLADSTRTRYLVIVDKLKQLERGASWATLFNGAVWSLLNVHRDTLRELGLFLEDLYSWSPKELRSVVVGKILAQDRVVRRKMVDRWFNRSDYRRGQVLSLLAVNIFRPWMMGEEPYGDDETAIRHQIAMEERGQDGSVSLRDREEVGKARVVVDDWREIHDRLSFSAGEGLLWFLNVCIGFYLPQILALNWTEAVSKKRPLKGLMSGNGWDLQHGPISAIRIADERQEIFSFGMMFLEPNGFCKALSDGKNGDVDPKSAANHSESRRELMLRIWTCYGFSYGRFWAAISLWRGLGFIGQVIELGLREHRALTEVCKSLSADLHTIEEGEAVLAEIGEKVAAGSLQALYGNLQLLVRSHCLAGLLPGSLLDRDSDEEHLRQAFPHWEPAEPPLQEEIERLAAELVVWLARCWRDRIFPMPAEKIWIGWRDCFVRRLHGEYVLGALWPRLNATYLEEQKRPDNKVLAAERSKPTGESNEDKSASDDVLWTAAVAAGVWSDVLLEYWRGCPQILRLLLSCPVFLKSAEIFEPEPGKVIAPQRIFEKQETDPSEHLRYKWLQRLSLPESGWGELAALWKLDSSTPHIPGLVSNELAIQRARIGDFQTRSKAQRNRKENKTKGSP